MNKITQTMRFRQSLIRNSCKFVPYKDRKKVCADLNKIYGVVNLDDAEYAKEEFRETWDKKYPNILKSWDRNWSALNEILQLKWQRLVLFFDLNITICSFCCCQ